MDQILNRPEASEAVSELGWRLLLRSIRTSVRVGSLAQAIELSGRALAACGDNADQHLSIDVRADRVILTLQSAAHAAVTTVDVELANRISVAVAEAALRTEPDSVQLVEIGIDALDIAAIRPFWKAILGYVDEGGSSDALLDPVGQAPAIWFQQMDKPRPDRNRLHFDISVPHDEAKHRMEAALAAGGRLLSAAEAPAFWVLADPEGNEACITTWQGRDS
jgi:4a-hydroxytetrahydrobiopterin dehydratase